MIITKLNAPLEYYPNASYHRPGRQTEHLLGDYYSQVSRKIMLDLFQDFSQELDFYYHLFTEEMGSHFKLLRTESDEKL